MRIPVSGDMTTDFVLIVIVIIIGVVLALKAEIKWGWVLVAGACYWAYLVVQPLMKH